MTVDLNPLTQFFKPFALTLVQPPLVFMLLAVAGGCRLQRGRKRMGWVLLGMAAAGIWLSGSEGFGLYLGRVWLKTPPALERAETERLRELQASKGGVAVLVLGGGARQSAPEYQGSSLNEYSLPRLRLGIWLARQIGAPLGFSGGVGWQAHDQISSEGEIARRIAAEEFRHPLSWVENQSRDTRENARFSVTLLRQHQVRTLVLVTHEQHMPRSLRAFKEALADSGAASDITLIPAPAGLRPAERWRLSAWLPSSEGYARVRYVVYEAIALTAAH